MHKDWTGGWNVRHNHDRGGDYLFCIMPDWSSVNKEGCRQDVTPVLCLEHGLEKRMQDVEGLKRL